MRSFDGQHVVIVGAGLAGSLLACSLGRLGFRVTLCERRADPREKGVVGGRSINLALSCRGITALEREGLAERVLADAIAMPGRMMHARSGDLAFQPYSKDSGDAINSVSRSRLNLTMLDAAAARDNVELRFGLRCVDVAFAEAGAGAGAGDAPVAVFVDEATGDAVRIEADFVFGADGAFSAVRGAMQKTDRFDYSQSYLEHGFKELVIPPAQACGVDPQLHDGFAMGPHALHIWPRGEAMMIALPNQDRTFTCTLFWPFEGEGGGGDEGGFASLDANDAAAVRNHFDKHYGDASALMPTLERDYAANVVGSLVTVRCAPWQRGGSVALVGDAAHAIVPFFGQGINAGFEDCRILVELIERKGGVGDAIEAYAALRKPDADAIAEMAIANFVEMRDAVGHAEFLYRKRIEQTLHAQLPDRAVPKYNMVSFTNVPYLQALREGDRLAAVVARIAVEVPESRELDDEAWVGEVVRVGSGLLGERDAAIGSVGV
jgi:kynurenine 3-monooxygenase